MFSSTKRDNTQHHHKAKHMTTDLKLYEEQLPAVPVAGFGEMTKRKSSFLQSIKHYNKGKEVTANKIQGGHYGIPDGDNVKVLGTTVDVLPFARRLKALDWGSDPTRISYDYDSEVFRDIRRRADEKGMQSNCMYGISILLFERSTAEWYEWYLVNDTSRPLGRDLLAYIPLTQRQIDAEGITGHEPHGVSPCTLGSYLKTGKKHSNHAPTVGPCSAPFTNAPTDEEIVKQIKAFVNPPTVTAAEAPERAR